MPDCAKYGVSSRVLFFRAAFVLLAALSFYSPVPSLAREAGWVPIEKYSSPLLKDSSPAPAKTPKKKPAPPPAPRQRGANAQNSVYAGQPPITEKELLAFVDILPQFRNWARAQREEAHPVLRGGEADFLFSPRAGEWVSEHGWDAPRFFCVMGKMAAALVIVEEGNDMKGTRPADMPDVAPQELSLARKHLGELLRVSFQPAPISQ